ncbi:MAG: rod shape-determining protein MreC [Acidobacteriota bacterium]|nr:rod shape-determining protein MreC [Acidobacteriota bacterium]MDQ5836641.1 rod shape-determining protein MreC [Acidobacteriota bacterium]
MKAKINRVVLLCLAGLLTAVQSPAKQEEVFKKFAGTYVTGHEFGRDSLTLEADGRFSEGSGSDDGTQVSTSGTYNLSNGRLHFIIAKQTWKRGSEGREFNLLDPKERKEIPGGEGDGEIQREFEMLPVEWSGRIYLLYEEDLKDFANAVNLGIEPRATLISYSYMSPWYGSFYLRSGDEQKKVTGNPPLSKQWLSFLLSKSVTATVISIEETKKYEFSTTFTATINKGTRDGLKVGMRLLTKDEEPSRWGGTQVISVEEKTAKIRTELVRSELKVGDKINSRYEPKIPYR